MIQRVLGGLVLRFPGNKQSTCPFQWNIHKYLLFVKYVNVKGEEKKKKRKARKHVLYVIREPDAGELRGSMQWSSQGGLCYREKGGLLRKSAT